MGKLITAIFGAGIFGSIVAMRKYVGIALVMIVSSLFFKADIVDYIKQTSKQEHEQKLAEINLETERMKVEAEARAKSELKQKEEYEKEQQELARKEKLKKTAQDKLDQEKRVQEEQRNKLANLQQKAQEKICDDYLKEYRAVLICSINPNDSKLCAPGYTSVSWLNYSKTIRYNAGSNGCNHHNW